MEINQLCQMGRTELNTNVMPFWLAYAQRCLADDEFAGVDFEGDIDLDLGVSSILLCRILWSFSSYYRFSKDKKYLAAAKAIKQRLLDRCFDRKTGFCYELPLVSEPNGGYEYKTLTQAYAIYALAEYAGVSGKTQDYEQAVTLINRVELAAKSRPYGVYADTISTSSQPEDDGLKHDLIDTRCQLHLVEGFVALLKVKNNDHVKTLLNELLTTFELCVYANAEDYFPLTLDPFWQPKQTDISVGHNFEAAWLLYDAASLAENDELKKLLGLRMLTLVDETLALAKGDTGIFWTWQFENGTRDEHLVWWVQTEALNAFLACFELTRDSRFLEQLNQLWVKIQNQFKDPLLGEWYTRLYPDGHVDKTAEKVGPWRGPYHIVRACLRMAELSDRLELNNNNNSSEWVEGEDTYNKKAKKILTQEISINV